MKIMVTGGAGFIGRALVDALIEHGHEVSVIDRFIKIRQHGVVYHQADLVNERLRPEWFDGINVLVHLAGAPIAGRRWTPAYRDELYASRVTSASRILHAISHLSPERRPRTIISASAVGIYGDRKDEILTEQSAPGDDFLAALCQDWEAIWDAEAARIVHVRTGIVINENGGMVSLLRPYIQFGLGMVMASGKQWVSWISLVDLVRVYELAIEDETLRGAVNAVAPRPFHQKEIIKRISRYYRRPVFLDVPKWLLTLVLGEASSVLVSSQRVKPTVLIDKKYQYQDLSIRSALNR